MKEPLNDGWEVRPEGGATWTPARLPGAWEELGFDKAAAGPVTYRRDLELSALAHGERLWLDCEAVSYQASVLLNGVTLGEHRGAWDPFVVELTPAARAGVNTLELVVEKPAGLRAGPDSPSLAGRFQLRETLSGFLPYVWGHMFGGPWQPVNLRRSGPAAILGAGLRAEADGRLEAWADLDLAPGAAAALSGVVLDGAGREAGRLPGVTLEGGAACRERVRLSARLSGVRPWSPDEPALYTLRLAVLDGAGQASDAASLSFGFRSVGFDGPTLLLNGQAVFPRLALSWGWFPPRFTPNAPLKEVRERWAGLRELGFNGLKYCLFQPPGAQLDLADRLGWLGWLEFPLWLPRLTPENRAPLLDELSRLAALSARHPSLILYTVGCELSADADAGFLGEAYSRVKAEVGSALTRDNSGSGEAYGGALDEHAEFDDYHLYAEDQHFGPLLDAFSPGARPERPYLFGEYADADVYRDPRQAQGEWWASADPAVNPQGARWQFDLPDLPERLRASGLAERGAELTRASLEGAMLHRKWTLERSRATRHVSGYVVTGEVDTPISTAGLLDAAGRPRFPAANFRAFNADLVLTLAWDHRRAWVAGGDRPDPLDPWNVTGGETRRARVVVANGAGLAGPGVLTWTLVDGATTLAGGRFELGMVPGPPREVGILRLPIPESSRPSVLNLKATLEAAGASVANSWSFIAYPPPTFGPGAALAEGEEDGPLAALAARLAGVQGGASVKLASAWTPRLASWVEGGGRAVLLVTRPGPVFGGASAPGLKELAAEALPFWREAIRLPEVHPAWGEFPARAAGGTAFWSLASDLALAGRPLGAQPILTRLDARSFARRDYALEIPLGRGWVIVTTLNFTRGLGEQPLAVTGSPARLHLLAAFARALEDDYDGTTTT